MKIKLIFFFFFFCSVIFAQEKQDKKNKTSNPERKNLLSIELGGNGLIYSFNYTRFFKVQENTSFSTRGGFEILWDRNGHYEFAAPFEFYLKMGNPRQKHFLETGLGITLLYTVEENDSPELTNYVFGRIGYCYHKPGSRFNLRIGFTPFTDYFFQPSSNDKVIQPFGGVSFGYLF
jgi:hypothetical protein